MAVLPGFTLKTSILVLFVQSILYGIYATTLIYCFRWLLYEDESWKLRPRNKVNWRMLITAILVHILSTADIGMRLSAALAGSLGKESTSHMLGAACAAIENTTLLLMDAILILRCWAIFDKSWRIVILPTLLWVSDAAIMVTFVCLNALVSGDLSGYFPSALICALFYACNFAINFYAAAAIAWKIWTVARYGGNKTGYLCTTGRILVESGIMHSVTSFMFIISLLAKPYSSIPPILCAVNISMAGIAFNLIFIRAGLQRTIPPVSDVDTQCLETASGLSYNGVLNTATTTRTYESR